MTLESSSEQPVLFVSHGGGPCWFMTADKGPMKDMDSTSMARRNLEEIAGRLYDGTDEMRPNSILVISAHWESSGENFFEVTNRDPPHLLYDYYGFPDDTYKLKYNCPHSTRLADRVCQLMTTAGLRVHRNHERGLDHGVFIPLKLIFPEAKLPVVQLSLNSSLDAALHLKLGAALRSLRREGVLIVGSGQATHNTFHQSDRSTSSSTPLPWAESFQHWLDETLTSDQLTSTERRHRLEHWASNAPNGRRAHPREEHLIPLLVCFEAAGQDGPSGPMNVAEKLFQGWAGGHLSLASYVWH